MNRSVEQVAETLRNNKKYKRHCSLLVGAGCSVKAGIPTAAGFVEIVKKDFPLAYNQAKEETYPIVMGEISKDLRRQLVARKVEEAKINWAHICIARLIQTDYVDRVLTTNFDNLVVQGCALLGVFPAVYDFAASQLLKPADIPEKAVFHLHGQHTGFVLIITKSDYQRHFKLLKHVFKAAGEGRTWIVVGYSGENDPVFKHLAAVKCFDNYLYWVGYLDNPPGEHVQKQLLVPGKDAFYVSGHDADSFFIRLATELKIFPPELINKPFTHLDQCFERLTTFFAGEDVTRVPRQWVRSAIETYESRPALAAAAEVPPTDVPDFDDSFLVAAQSRLMSGDYEGAVSLQQKYEESPSPSAEVAETLAKVLVIESKENLKKELEEKSGDMVREIDKKFKKDKDNAEV
jgi:hypothetical protein